MYIPKMSDEELERAVKQQIDIFKSANSEQLNNMNVNNFGQVKIQENIEAVKGDLNVDDYTINLKELQDKMKALSQGQDKTLGQAIQEAINNYLPTQDTITHLGTSAAELYFGSQTVECTEGEFYAYLAGFEAGAQEIVDGLNK